MAAISELDRRLTKVESETVHIYDLIEERSAEFRQRFDAVDQKFDAVDRKFDAVNQRLDKVDQRLDSVDQTLSEHGTALAEILRRLPEPA